MGHCSAPGCKSHSRNKCRMFRFPRNEVRKRKWIENCRGNGWVPGSYAEVCDVSILFVNSLNYILMFNFMIEKAFFSVYSCII